MRLESIKSALLTGGSSGIGRSVATRLAQRGIGVFLVARNADRLNDAVTKLKQHNVRVGCFAADVADAEQAAAAVAAAERDIGPLQLIVNAAGVSTPGYVLASPPEAFAEQMSVNYAGTVHVLAAALPSMVERKDGWVVNVSSAAGLKGVFGYAGYCASKFAVIGYSEVLRAEMREHGIGVSVLCPPDTRTPMLEREEQLRPMETRHLAAMGEILEPEAVADALLRGLRRGTFKITPGRDAWMMQTADRIVPGLVDWYMARAVRNAQRKR